MDNVPFIYLGFLPVWLVATLLWAWNNVRHGRHVRELHRRLSLLTLRYPTLAYPSLPYPKLTLSYPPHLPHLVLSGVRAALRAVHRLHLPGDAAQRALPAGPAAGH